MQTTDRGTYQARGLVYQEDDDHDEGGYVVAAVADVALSDENEVVVTVRRGDDTVETQLYLSFDQTRDLIVALAGTLARG